MGRSQHRKLRQRTRCGVMQSALDRLERVGAGESARNLDKPRTRPPRPPPKLRGMQRRIAVIEDEPTIAGSVAARLRAEGFDVEIARDGTARVDLCRTYRPDP